MQSPLRTGAIDVPKSPSRTKQHPARPEVPHGPAVNGAVSQLGEECVNSTFGTETTARSGEPLPDGFARLDNRWALVTGASSGIGRAIAVEFARAGADLVIHAGRNAEGAAETADLVQQFGRRAEVLVRDLAEPDGHESIVEHVWSLTGGIAVWVNNAGADLLTGGANDLPYGEKLDRLLDVDVRATVQLSKLVGERMRERGQGVILTVGWDQSDRGMGGDSGELFATAKNAIMGFTRSLAVSLAPTVRVNCIAPGWIRTAWGETASEYWQERVRRETPLERWGTPEDIAHVARFLASDEASYLTGQVINVNGGAVR